jgi:protein-tyrosine phosphatase
MASVLDLRSAMEVRPERVAFIKAVDILYYNVSLEGDEVSAAPEENFFSRFANMGDFYLFMLKNRGFNLQLIKALKVVADAANHPVLFHCTVGKDRTGILAAFILDIIGVGDEDIVADYVMTGANLPEFIERMKSDTKTSRMLDALPGFFWEAVPESMEVLLGTLRSEHGSLRKYLEARGVEPELFRRLEEALLE